MIKPNDWNDVVVGEGAKPELPVGNYIIKIVGCKEQTSSKGNPMLVFAVEIDEGEHKGYGNELAEWKTQFNQDHKKKWDNSMTLYVNLKDFEGKTNRSFKSCITALEKSNNMQWDWNAKSLVNKKCVGVFPDCVGFYNGKFTHRTKINGFRSLDSFDKLPMPKEVVDKEAKTAGYGTTAAQAAVNEVNNMFGAATSDDDIPF